jgi:RNA polymerase sigma-32 factor
MSRITLELEAAVQTVLDTSLPPDRPASPRQRATVDRAFATILRLIAPRIRHFIRQYGLVAHWEDAEQCCAIAVHRAIQSYDPAKAQFTTFVNWQIRGELQGLRFRLMVDQRPSARKVSATTVSMHGISSSIDGEDMSLESVLEDENAVYNTESAASDYLARAATTALVDAFIAEARRTGIEQIRARPRPKRAPRQSLRPHGIEPAELEKLDEKLARDREIIENRMFETSPIEDATITRERARQITRRAAQGIADLAARDPRFAIMAG